MTKQKKERRNTEKAASMRPQFETVSPAIIIDLIKYAHHLDGLDLSEEQKMLLLQALSNIAWNFLAMGAEIHPLQAIKSSCGKPTIVPENPPFSSQNEVSSLGQFIEENISDFTVLESDGNEEGV